jgi:hypothetical protein
MLLLKQISRVWRWLRIRHSSTRSAQCFGKVAGRILVIFNLFHNAEGLIVAQ